MVDRPDEKSLVVVADGTRAILFRKATGDADIKLRHEADLTPINLDDDGPAGVRPPESSKQETDQATFAKQLAFALNDKALRREFDELILIIDPQTLGQLRPSLHKKVEDRVRYEIAKNYVNASVDDIVLLLASTINE